MTHFKTPVFLFAFANDDGYSLRQLDEEQRAITQILEPGGKEGKFIVKVLPAATAEDLIRAFQEYRGRIYLFHYGGHSNQDKLFFKQSFQDQKAMRAENLAEFLALQKGLELIFLNSCLSLDQARIYHEAGVKAVIATSQRIKDDAARQFAGLFYEALATGASLNQAYQEAEKGMDMQLGGSARGILLRSEMGPDQFPWQVFPAQLHFWRFPLVAKYLTRIPSIDLKKEFLGRDADMQRLKDKLESTYKVVLMSGLGGIGKTVLATAYVQQYGNNYNHLAWVNRGEDLIESMALNEELADTLGLSFEQEEGLKARFRQLLSKLHLLPGQNLLVIDNAQTQVAQKEVYDHLPGAPNWKVLLTSRLNLSGFDHLKLGTLPAEAARKLFRTYFKGGYTEEELEALLKEIGYHTLTIELLAKLLDKLNNLVSVSNLTEILKKQQLDNPDLQEKIWTRYSGEERCIYLHLMKAFELIQLTEKEKWLMIQFVVLPVERYPIVTIAELLEKKSFEINNILNELSSKGWLNKHEDKSFSIHRLIRQVAEYQLQPSYEDVKVLVKTMIQRFKLDLHKSPISKNAPWISYAVSIESFVVHENDEKVAELQTKIADTYRFMGKNLEALNFYKKALAIRENLFEGNHPSIATSLSNIATIYHAMDKNSEAMNYHKKAFDIINNEFELNDESGKGTFYFYDDSALDVFYNNIAETYRSQKRFKEALSYHKLALEIRKNLGDDHPALATSYNNIANVFGDIGKNMVALEYHKKALEIRENALNADHHLLGQSYNNIAVTYSELGEHEEAMIYNEKALAIWEDVLDPNHPDLRNLYYNIALNYRDLGKHKEAQICLLKVQTFNKKH